VTFSLPTATDALGNRLSLLPPAGAKAFADDFDSYAVGSNLSGQGGWAGGKLLVGQGMIDGQLDSGTGKMETAQHPLPAPGSAGAIDLSFQVLAYTRTTADHTRSHNTAVALGTADSALAVNWFPDTNYGISGSEYYPYPVWCFDARGITG